MGNQDNPNDSVTQIEQIEQIKSFIQKIRKDFHKKYPRVIGKGGYGHIILNQTQDTENKYAVKKGDITKSNINQLEFYDKILRHKQVDRNYYPTIYTTDKDILNTYIVMEYLDPEEGWKTLKDIYIHNYNHKNEKINVEEYFLTISTILDHFHEKNIIHNDIKSENIMINIKTDDVKFIDFGFSFTNKTCGTDIKILQQGTPLYMLPIDEERNMTKERIMELGKQKDRFALKVCEFYQFFEKPFLLDIPFKINLTSYNIPLVLVHQFFYKWLLKRLPSYHLTKNFIITEYNKSKPKYDPQLKKFEEMFAEFIKK